MREFAGAAQARPRVVKTLTIGLWRERREGGTGVCYNSRVRTHNIYGSARVFLSDQGALL